MGRVDEFAKFGGKVGASHGGNELVVVRVGRRGADVAEQVAEKPPHYMLKVGEADGSSGGNRWWMFGGFSNFCDVYSTSGCSGGELLGGCEGVVEKLPSGEGGSFVRIVVPRRGVG